MPDKAERQSPSDPDGEEPLSDHEVQKVSAWLATIGPGDPMVAVARRLIARIERDRGERKKAEREAAAAVAVGAAMRDRVSKLTEWADEWTIDYNVMDLIEDGPRILIARGRRKKEAPMQWPVIPLNERTGRSTKVVTARYEINGENIRTLEIGPIDLAVVMGTGVYEVAELTLASARGLTVEDAERWCVNRALRGLTDAMHGTLELEDGSYVWPVRVATTEVMAHKGGGG